MPKKRTIVEKLRPKEKQFCENIARGFEPVEAYRQAYQSEAGEEYILSTVKGLLTNKLILAEIKRMKVWLGLEDDDEDDVEELSGSQNETMNKTDDTSTEGIVDTNDINWSQGIAFNRLKRLLDSCDGAMEFLKERPQLFANVERLVTEVRNKMAQELDSKTLKDIYKTLDNIEGMIYKLTTFNAKEYNSTMTTANALMKEINSLTGVKKNAQSVKNETFEEKLLKIISSQKDKTCLDIGKEMEEYAFSDKT